MFETVYKTTLSVRKMNMWQLFFSLQWFLKNYYWAGMIEIRIATWGTRPAAVGKHLHNFINVRVCTTYDK